jgi:DNA-binding GntR family transcriptional regulator
LEKTISNQLDGVRKVASHTRLSETTEAIRTLVLDGIVPTGARLKDLDLAAALGVSRATVREAVRELVHEGLLVHEPYKGLRVASVDDQGWLDLSEVRAALEVVGARRVAERLTPAMDAQIEAALQRLRAARAVGNVAGYHEAHIGLHGLIQHLSGNPVLEQTWAILEQRARAVLRIDYETRPDLDRAATHLELIAAIRSRDRGRIASAVNDHVINSAKEQIRRRAERPGHDDGDSSAKKPRSSHLHPLGDLPSTE